VYAYWGNRSSVSLPTCFHVTRPARASGLDFVKVRSGVESWAVASTWTENSEGLLSVGLQGSFILFLNPDRFDLTVGGRRRLFQAIAIFQALAIYSRVLFSYRLPFRSITDYFNPWEYPHLFVLRSLVRIQSFIPILSL
jgi:hypothetical protein